MATAIASSKLFDAAVKLWTAVRVSLPVCGLLHRSASLNRNRARLLIARARHTCDAVAEAESATRQQRSEEDDLTDEQSLCIVGAR